MPDSENRKIARLQFRQLPGKWEKYIEDFIAEENNYTSDVVELGQEEVRACVKYNKLTLTEQKPVFLPVHGMIIKQ